MNRVSLLAPVVCLALMGSLLVSCAPSTSSSGGASASSQGATSRLKLKNDFGRDVIVRLKRLGDAGHRDVIVPARSSKSLTVKSGTYKYSAAAEGFRPFSHWKELEPNRSYTLYF